jgi:hypothetical protein
MALQSRPLLDARLRLARQCRRSRSYRDLQGIAHPKQSWSDRRPPVANGSARLRTIKTTPLVGEALRLDTAAPSKAT